jgi:hypothetical protein
MKIRIDGLKHEALRLGVAALPIIVILADMAPPRIRF